MVTNFAHTSYSKFSHISPSAIMIFGRSRNIFLHRSFNYLKLFAFVFFPVGVTRMLIAEISPYAAIAVTLVVWTLTQRANRKHEIFKERLKRRVELFDGLLPEISRFVDALHQYNGNEANTNAVLACQDALTKLGSYRVKMLCYGTDEEQRVYEEYIDAIESRKMDILAAKNRKLVDLVKRNLRKEVGIK